MIIIYKSITSYEFTHDYIKETFENKKEYYYLGFQSIEYYITKIIYNYLVKYNHEISFCCDFTLLQKIVKRISSKEYFKKQFNLDEKYIYSLIGAVICDNNLLVEDVVKELYDIEGYLLSIFKKEDNKYLFVKKYLDKNKYHLETTYTYLNDVTCTCYLVELNHYFSNSAKTMLEAKYIILEEIANYLVENKLYYNIEEVLGDYSIDNAVEKLDLLYDRKYINKPNYFYVTHDQFEVIKYEVRCSIDNLSFYSIKIHDSKNIAKNQAAFSMLEMIIIQNNT